MRLVLGDIVSVFFKGSDHLVDMTSLVLRLTFGDEDNLWRSTRREGLVNTGGRRTSRQQQKDCDREDAPGCLHRTDSVAGYLIRLRRTPAFSRGGRANASRAGRWNAAIS